MPRYQNPAPTVDLIIEIKDPHGRLGIVLIKRKNPPFGWALPGGFVDYGESCEDAAVREAYEETSLHVRLVGQLHTYSAPGRDPRKHTITTVFIARGKGTPRGQDDALEAAVFVRSALPKPLAFDHELILSDYFKRRRRASCRAAGRTTKGTPHGRGKKRA
jgi:ADP-ribose pyrophosphatase YjhB (NUDIX family)